MKKIKYPPPDWEAQGITGWFMETVDKIVPKKYDEAFNDELGCVTGAIDEKTGKIVLYTYDVINALEKVMFGTPYEWD